MPLGVPLTEFRIYSTGVNTILTVTYQDGGLEAFSVPSDKIFISSSIDDKEFCKVLKENAENDPENV